MRDEITLLKEKIKDDLQEIEAALQKIEAVLQKLEEIDLDGCEKVKIERV